LNCSGRWHRRMMDAGLVGGECDCDQNEHDDEHDALFVGSEFENPE
jgi:hypothetical protein